MPQKDYRAYMQTERGKAARARAQANYLAKRKAGHEADKPCGWMFTPLVEILKNWKSS